MTKVFLLALAFVGILLSSVQIEAGYVNGHTKKNGSYVSGYYRSESNNTVKDNYSYYGNTN